MSSMNLFYLVKITVISTPTTTIISKSLININPSNKYTKQKRSKSICANFKNYVPFETTQQQQKKIYRPDISARAAFICQFNCARAPACEHL